MSNIRRWDVQTMDERTSSEGKWVLHSDYEQVLEHVQILWAQKVVERDAEIARLRAEADANRVDAERWRHARQQNGVTVSIEESDDDGDKQFVSGHSPEELDEAIDAALSGQE